MIRSSWRPRCRPVRWSRARRPRPGGEGSAPERHAGRAHDDEGRRRAQPDAAFDERGAEQRPPRRADRSAEGDLSRPFPRPRGEHQHAPPPRLTAKVARAAPPAPGTGGARPPRGCRSGGPGDGPARFRRPAEPATQPQAGATGPRAVPSGRATGNAAPSPTAAMSDQQDRRRLVLPAGPTSPLPPPPASSSALLSTDLDQAPRRRSLVVGVRRRLDGWCRIAGRAAGARG